MQYDFTPHKGGDMQKAQSMGLLSTKKTAELFGISEGFLRTHKDIPVYHFGKRNKYDPAELKMFFKQHSLLRNR